MWFFKRSAMRLENVFQTLGVKCIQVAVPVNFYFRGNIRLIEILLNIYEHRLLEKQKTQDEAIAAQREVEEIRAAFDKEIKILEEESGKDKNSKPRR